MIIILCSETVAAALKDWAYEHLAEVLVGENSTIHVSKTSVDPSMLPPLTDGSYEIRIEPCPNQVDDQR